MTDPRGEPRPCYKFGIYTLDCEARVLFRERVTIQTTGKMILLLQALLEKPGYIVGKYEFLDVLWPNQEVSEWSLSRLVSDTRQELKLHSNSCVSGTSLSPHSELGRTAPSYLAIVRREGIS